MSRNGWSRPLLLLLLMRHRLLRRWRWRRWHRERRQPLLGSGSFVLLCLPRLLSCIVVRDNALEQCVQVFVGQFARVVTLEVCAV
jgi:hypothetical protein